MWGMERRKIQDIAVAPRERRVSRNQQCSYQVIEFYVAPRERRVSRNF